MELYRYDFSEFDGADVGSHGEYGYRYLDHYWAEPGDEAIQEFDSSESAGLGGPYVHDDVVAGRQT